MHKSRKSTFTKLSKKVVTVVLAASLIEAPFAHATTSPPPSFELKGDVIVADDINWMTSHLSSNMDRLSINLEQHFSTFDPNSLTLSVSSSDVNIATSVVNGKVLELQLKSQGTAMITITATDSSGKTIVEQFNLIITKSGDTDGDGVITPSDALFVYKVINGKVTLTEYEKKLVDIDGDGQITAKDATAIMNAYSGKASVIKRNEYFISLKDENDAPVVHGVTINGTVKVGQTVTGTYQYMDIENDLEASTRFQWYRGTDESGVNKVAISGANTRTYIIQSEDAGKYLFFEVTPISSSGNVNGIAKTSLASNKVIDYAPLLDKITWAQGSTKGTTKVTGLPNGKLKYVIGTAGQFTRPYESDVSTEYSKDLTTGLDIPVLAGQQVFIVSVDNDNNITGWINETIDNQNIKLGTPPSLIPDILVNHLGTDIEISFVDDGTWSGDIQDVLLDNVSLNGRYTVINGKIIINKNEFNTVKDYQIQISANGYENAIVRQTILENQAPTVNNVFISGNTKVGNDLTGNYQYSDLENDAEGASTYQWYRSDVADGVGKEPIENATSRTYTLQSQDENKYIFFEVVPNATNGLLSGDSQISSSSSIVTNTIPVTMTASLPYQSNLSEDNLEASVVNLDITGDSFKEGLSIDDIQLNNAPVGLEANLVFSDETSAMLLFGYDGLDFDADIPNFNVTVKANGLASGEEVTSENILITAINEPNTPSVYISEYLQGPNGQVGLELYFEGIGSPPELSNYQLEAHYWVNNQIQIARLSIPAMWGTVPYTIIDDAFYEFMDVSGAFYINNFLPALSGKTLQALVLKKGGRVVDVVGNPDSPEFRPILTGHLQQLIVRKPTFIGGSPQYYPYQWFKYNNNNPNNYDIFKQFVSKQKSPY